jgi:hypothetical protein
MPRGDGTGPLGWGPMTRRAAAGGGFRNRFRAGGVPFGECAASRSGGVLPRDEEIVMLEEESRRLHSMLDAVQRRLAEIETE